MTKETKTIYQALVAAQAEFEHAKKDSDNPFFNSKYADLASVIATAKPVLKKHGLAVVHRREVDASLNEFIITMLIHEGGETLESRSLLNPVKKDPQGMGSAITYARRYDMQSLLGLAADDDDGNSASQGKPETAASKKKRYKAIKDDIEAANDISELHSVWQAHQPAIAGFKIEDEQYFDDLYASKEKRKEEIAALYLEAAGYPQEFNDITKVAANEQR